MPRFRQTKEILELMDRKERIRNIGVIAHIDHGKTTMTDSLLVEAGLLPSQVAGSARALDYLEEEQKRGITIKTANISLLHQSDGASYVINVVDTPGHVDFSGKVARALRAIDGAIVVVDAVEEVMAQTETVTRQALEERVKPILFINKVDRLMTEMKLTPTEIQAKFLRIIDDFDNLIEVYGEPDFKEKWKVDPAKESVVFGSALHKWGFTLNVANKKGIKFSDHDIADAYRKGRPQTLSRLIPLHTAILDVVVKNVPSPVESQNYRIPKIWKGDIGSEIGQAMLNCDDKGPTTMCITNAQVTSDTDVVATGRLFSGSIRDNDEVYLLDAGRDYRVEQVSMYMGAFREPTNRIGAGNIAALTGLDSARAGETLVDNADRKTMVPFERVKYISEPVMTVAVEPRRLTDLPRLTEAMNRLSIEDPNLVTTIDKETGQYLISGMGVLHLEIAVKFLRQYTEGMEITASNPVAAYRESILKQGAVVMTKSPNKNNRFWIQAEPLENKVLEAMESRDFGSEVERKQSIAGSCKEAENVWAFEKNKNTLINTSQKAKCLREVKDSIITGFQWACRNGPLCGEPLRGVKVKLMDAQIHEDQTQRKPRQVVRAVSRAILGSCLTANPALLECIYRIEVSAPTQWFGTCANMITRRRGKIRATNQKGASTVITGYIPVAETLNLSAEMRSATSGHAFWQFTFDHWEKIPEKLAAEATRRLRQRKGLPMDIPGPKMFVDEVC